MKTYYTKDQMDLIFKGWGVNEALPRKGFKVVIAFPRPAMPSVATITVAKEKSTYGKMLYQVEFSNE